MADINKVWLSGVVTSQPVLTNLPVTKTPLSYFTLQVNEEFKDRSGVTQVKPNFIRVESLGKGARLTMENVKLGRRYMVDGYVRQDSDGENDFVRVRSFAIHADDSNDSVNYEGGLKQALRVLERSGDLDTAIGKIKEMLD